MAKNDSDPQLQLHHLRPAAGSKKVKHRVGRGDGGKGGTTAGRGTKGLKARGQVPARFEGGQTPIHMRIPKRRGLGNPRRAVDYQVVNLEKLSEHYEAGADVNAENLAAKGLVRSGHPVKVLGSGEISVALNVTADSFSASAKEKIESAGGSTTIA